MSPTSALPTIESLVPGDHLCCLYETDEEHRALFTPYLQKGLELGQKALYIVDAYTAEVVLGYLRNDGIEVEAYLTSEQLRILTVDDAYMKGGTFDPDGMIDLLRTEMERALAEGYSALRVTGEMTWALRGLPGSERLIEYESKLSILLSGSKCLALCQYDRRRFAPEILLDMITTHPTVCVGTKVCDNFYYLTPTEFLGPDRVAVTLHHWLENLVEWKQAGEALEEYRDHLEKLVGERTAQLQIINELLQWEITERKQAEEKIVTSLKEKETLLREIHHRVKNNLQVVSSLLYLQSEHIKDEQILDILRESQNRVKAMAFVHEQLYQSRDLKAVDFAEYIQSLSTYLFDSHGVSPDDIDMKTNVKDIKLDIDVAIPCGLIVNELVSNSLGHAFPSGEACSERQAEVRVDLRADGDKLTLTVSDNGVGFPKDLDFRNIESLGLHLVMTLTRQLEGTIELDRSTGTRFEITFTRP